MLSPQWLLLHHPNPISTHQKFGPLLEALAFQLRDNRTGNVPIQAYSERCSAGHRVQNVSAKQFSKIDCEESDAGFILGYSEWTDICELEK